MSFAVWCRMVYQCIMVNVLLSFDDCDAFQSTVDVLALVIKIKVVSRKIPAKRKRMHTNIGLFFLGDVCIVNQRRFEVVILDFIVINDGSFACKDFGNRIGQDWIVI